jgi:hypothetical protein
LKPVDEERELARLLASEASPLGASLSALRERGPDASELGLLASRLSLGGIDVVSPPKAPVTAPKPWKPWLVAGGGGGVAIGLLWLAFRGAAPAPAAGNDGDTATRSGALETSRHQTTPPRAPTERRVGSSLPVGSAALEPTPADVPSPAQAELAKTEARTQAEAPSLLGSEHDPAASKPAAPAGAAPGGVARGSSSLGVGGSAAGVTPSPSSVPGAPSEIELLRDARLALRQSPASALAFAEQHARLYPQGKLSQERELIAISALAASGRRTAALSRGARFEQSFPTSPYRKQLAELLK